MEYPVKCILNFRLCNDTQSSYYYMQAMFLFKTQEDCEYIKNLVRTNDGRMITCLSQIQNYKLPSNNQYKVIIALTSPTGNCQTSSVYGFETLLDMLKDSPSLETNITVRTFLSDCLNTAMLMFTVPNYQEFIDKYGEALIDYFKWLKKTTSVTTDQIINDKFDIHGGNLVLMYRQ